MPDALPTPRFIVASPQPKPALQSKIILLNAAVLAMTGLEANLNLFQPLLPVNVYALVAFGLPVANMILRRWFTTRPIGAPVDYAEGVAQQHVPEPTPATEEAPPGAIALDGLGDVVGADVDTAVLAATNEAKARVGVAMDRAADSLRDR